MARVSLPTTGFVQSVRALSRRMTVSGQDQSGGPRPCVMGDFGGPTIRCRASLPFGPHKPHTVTSHEPLAPSRCRAERPAEPTPLEPSRYAARAARISWAARANWAHRQG